MDDQKMTVALLAMGVPREKINRYMVVKKQVTDFTTILEEGTYDMDPSQKAYELHMELESRYKDMLAEIK